MVTSLSLGSVVSHSAHKRILLAEPRGYCAGVDRAIDTVVKALERYGAPIYVRREIVHNKHVITTLAEKGAIFVNDIDDVPAGQRLVFSAHGVAPVVREKAAELQLHTIDATCPLVTKVHNEVKRFAKSGYTILLIGHPGHEEVEGTAGEAPESVILIDTVDTARTIAVPENSKLIWLSQTTLSVDETAEIVAHLKQRFDTLEDPPSDDICYATQNRQSAVKMMAPLCDVVIVVGSINSSNSVRLVEVALQSGAKAAYLVDYYHEIDDHWLADATTIGVTSGASVPEVLVEGVVEFLANHGFDSIESVNVASESLVFSLPRELRSA